MATGSHRLFTQFDKMGLNCTTKRKGNRCYRIHSRCWDAHHQSN